MKKIVFSVFMFTFLFMNQTFSQESSQFMFCVRPQLFGMAGASFGVKLPLNLVIYGGLDYTHLGTTVDLEDVRVSPFGSSSDKNESEGSLNLYNLFVGGKFFLIKSNAVKGYVMGEVSKPILGGSIEVDGKKVQEVDDALDNLTLWGIKAGVGSEYFFSDNFSIGGEFGFRIFLANYNQDIKSTSTEYYYNNIPPYFHPYSVEKTTKVNVDFNFSTTYTALSLNYYF